MLSKYVIPDRSANTIAQVTNYPSFLHKVRKNKKINPIHTKILAKRQE